ncbi:MAG: hypothetical protein ACFFB3_01545 [Candidatus Hodarchaeota archaeon]
MKIIYRHYEPGKNLEEFQAQIYNAATKNLPGSNAASAAQILQRYETEKVDPQGVRYALKEDESPLAYVQTRITENPQQTWIGYPWAVPDCSSDVQEKLWTETFEYIKKRDLETAEEVKIVIGYFDERWEEQIAFAKKKGFEEDDRGYQFALDVIKGSDVDYSSYSARLANTKDIEALIELCKADPDVSGAFPTEEAWLSYFQDRVLPDGNTILVFDSQNQLVCAGAPLHGFSEDGVIVRFSAILPGSEAAFKPLLIEICKRCVERGWEDLPLLFFGGNERNRRKTAEELGGIIRTTTIAFAMTAKRS